MFARLLAAAAVIHLIAAWFSVGHYHADEYYSLLGYAGFKLGIVTADTLPHEYARNIRAGFMPLIAYSTAKALSAAGIDSPFVWAFVLRLLSAALALGATVVFFCAYGGEIKDDKIRRHVLTAMLFLYPLVFYHVRFSAEGWMASFLLLALAAHRRAEYTAAVAPRFVGGLLLGIMFLSRYQSGLVVFSLALWIIFVRRDLLRHVLFYGGGFLCAQVFGFVADKWAYGTPVFPALEYFQFHVSEGIPGATRPWHTYFTRVAVMLPPLSLFIPLLLIAFYWKFPRHIFTWATALFMLAHLLIANKQTRFLFPLLPFLPLMFAMLWEKYVVAMPTIKRWAIRGLKISAAINLPLLAFVMFFPAAKEVALLQNCIVPKIAGKTAAIYIADKHDGVLTELNLGFYGVAGADFIHMSKVADFVPVGRYEVVLFASRKASYRPPPNANATLICRALPKWITAVNINNWVSRASVWRVWEIHTNSKNRDGEY